MKEQSRVPFKWQLNPRGCLPFRETTFHRVRLCSRSLMKASLISESMTLCVCVRVSSPQSPWQWCPIQPGTCRDKRWGRREEGGGGVQSVSQAGGKQHQNGRRALARCWCIEKNRLPKIIQLHLPFGITQGAATQVRPGLPWRHMPTVTRLCICVGLEKKKTFRKRQKHSSDTHLNHFSHVQWDKLVLKSPGSPMSPWGGYLGGPTGAFRNSQTILSLDI